MLLTDFTFKDTGISVKLRKISPMLAADVSASMPEPQPPEVEVNYGEPKGIVKEPNLSDPNYAIQLQEHQVKVYRTYRRVMILRSIDRTSLPEDWQQQVTEYRQLIKEQTGKDLDEPEDLVVFILRIAVGSPEDLNELITTITRRSQPTPEGVALAKESFPGSV